MSPGCAGPCEFFQFTGVIMPSAFQSVIWLIASTTVFCVKFLPAALMPSASSPALTEPTSKFSVGSRPFAFIAVNELGHPLVALRQLERARTGAGT